MTEEQKESLIGTVYALLMENPDMDMGDMGNCREAAEQTVENWIRKNEIKNLKLETMRTRVYAIDLYEIDGSVTDLTDEEFIDIAEQQGKVWTLPGFEKAFNDDEISDQWIIKIITT